MIQRAFVYPQLFSHGSEGRKRNGTTLGYGFRSRRRGLARVSRTRDKLWIGFWSISIIKSRHGSTSEERIVMLLRILEARQSGTIEALSASSVEGDYSAFFTAAQTAGTAFEHDFSHSVLIKSLLRSLVTFSEVNSSGPGLCLLSRRVLSENRHHHRYPCQYACLKVCFSRH